MSRSWRRTGKIEVSFSREETLKRDNIRLEDNRLIFIFISYFYLVFILNLGLEVSVMSHITVTVTCHTIMYYRKHHKKFWNKDDIIQHILYMLTLRKIHSSLG